MNVPFLELTVAHQHQQQRYVACLFSFCFFWPLIVTSPFVLMPITVHHRRTHWRRYVTSFFFHLRQRASLHVTLCRPHVATVRHVLYLFIFHLTVTDQRCFFPPCTPDAQH